MFRLSGLLHAVWKTVTSGGDVMAKGKFYYAVRKGFKPGVYKTWDECKTQVEKFPSAEFKKFEAERDAWAFFRGQNPSPAPPKPPAALSSELPVLPKRGPEPLEYIPLGPKRRHLKEEAEETPGKRLKEEETPGKRLKEEETPGKRLKEEETPGKRLKEEETPGKHTQPGAESADTFTYMGGSVVVYTDGGCTGNGTSSARAGIGVYWGPNHPLNVSERLEGRQTNQRAEILAACRALELAKQNQIDKVVLFTDSKFTINGVTRWVKTWKANGWKLKSGGTITNKEEFMRLDQLNSQLQVKWMHIPGHSGYRGNEEADRLSREGANKPSLD